MTGWPCDCCCGKTAHYVWPAFYNGCAHSWPGRKGGRDWSSTVALEGVAQMAQRSLTQAPPFLYLPKLSPGETSVSDYLGFFFPK